MIVVRKKIASDATAGTAVAADRLPAGPPSNMSAPVGRG